MPITKKEFEEADRPLDERIIATLERENGNALDLIDLIASTDGYPTRSDAALVVLIERTEAAGKETIYARYQAEVDALLAAGRVREASVRGTSYYALAKGKAG